MSLTQNLLEGCFGSLSILYCCVACVKQIPLVLFQVGWSTARDYYTFLWSPLLENYVEGTTVNRVVVFQGETIE